LALQSSSVVRVQVLSSWVNVTDFAISGWPFMISMGDVTLTI